MLKNQLNYRLINIAIICLIVYLTYISRNLWLIIFKTLSKIFIPFIFAFFIAYIFYPLLNYLIKKKIPKSLGIIIIITSIIGIIILISITVCPTIINQSIQLINYIITFINKLSLKYNINLLDFQNYLYELLKYLGEYISNSAINIISYSIDYITKTLIIAILSIYFLIDMDKIREKIKKLFIKNNFRQFNLLKTIDKEMKNYFSAFIKIMIISFFEYSICYIIIGHPNAIILGLLVAIFGLIPYVGGIITNLIAGITAFIIGPNLFIKTLICFLILSIIDGYIINPLVYGKSNKIHPLINIFAIISGGILGGIMGMIIALPITIVICSILKFYKINLFFIKNKIKNNLKY